MFITKTWRLLVPKQHLHAGCLLQNLSKAGIISISAGGGKRGPSTEKMISSLLQREPAQGFELETGFPIFPFSSCRWLDLRILLIFITIGQIVP